MIVCCRRTVILYDECCFFFPQTFLNQGFESEPLPDADATISLPSALEDFFSPGQRNKTRVQFHFYGTQKLFQVHVVSYCRLPFSPFFYCKKLKEELKVLENGVLHLFDSELNGTNTTLVAKYEARARRWLLSLALGLETRSSCYSGLVQMPPLTN